jgi:hypothetical protein
VNESGAAQFNPINMSNPTDSKSDGSQAPVQIQRAAIETVKLIGLGGVGGIVARYLSVFLAAQPLGTRLVLIDGDAFEPSNASRMLFGECGNKAAVLREELLPRIADSPLTLLAIEEFVTPANIEQLLQDGDVVIMAVDNHATRKLVNDYCARQLRNVCLISGGNDGVSQEPDGRNHRGTYGNVQVYWRRDGADMSPSLSRYHPEIAEPSDKHPLEKDCSELVTTVPQILFTNMLVATSILGTFWLHFCDALHYSEVAFDLADALMRPVPIPFAGSSVARGPGPHVPPSQ